jgi:hypothetical protein
MNVFVWIDTETLEVVDAGFYDNPPWVQGAFQQIGDHQRCLPAMVGTVPRPTPESLEIFGERGRWLEQMPTIQWQLAWAACSGSPCYAAPTPPNEEIAGGLTKI